jgi:hypothetical protein
MRKTHSILPALFLIALAAALPLHAQNKSSREQDQKTVKEESSNTIPKSVFTINKDFKDPFYPKTTQSAPDSTKAAPVSAMDIDSALRIGFQGVMGAGDRRLAVINNVILEPGRHTTVPVHFGATSKNVRVRVIEVLKNGVVVEVEGQTQALTITRPDSR